MIGTDHRCEPLPAFINMTHRQTGQQSIKAAGSKDSLVPTEEICGHQRLWFDCWDRPSLRHCLGRNISDGLLQWCLGKNFCMLKVKTVVSLFYAQLNSCHLYLFFSLRSWICRYEQQLLTWATFRETRSVKNRDKRGNSPQTHRHRNNTPRHLPSVGINPFLICPSPVKNRTKFSGEFCLFPNQSPADEICWFISKNSWVQGDSEKTAAAKQTQSFQPKAKDAPVFSQGTQEQTVL